MKKNLFITLLGSFLVLSSNIVSTVSAVDYSDVVSFTDTEKFKSFQVYEDINGVFEKEGSKQFNKDRDLVLLYNEESKHKQIFILNKEPGIIIVRGAKPEAEEVIADFISDKGISAEKIEISGYPNILITSSELDVITRQLADELCCYLTEKEYISEFHYREQCYFAGELSTSINRYMLSDADDVRKIKEIASEIKLDADVKIEHEEPDTVICRVSIKDEEGIKSYIDLAEAVHKELGVNPMYGVYDAPAYPLESSDSEIIYSDGEVSSVPGDIISNQSVDITDLSALSLALIGDISLNDDQLKSADVDGDGKVTIADLARLRQYLSKKIESF